MSDENYSDEYLDAGHAETKLDAERRHGTTASGLIRHLLEQHFKQARRKSAA